MAGSTVVGMSAGESGRQRGESERVLARHPSLDEAFDPAVRAAEHDAAWARQADEELRRIGEALGPLAVRLEHVGSTAVPGLAAKAILDLQLSVASIEPRGGYVGRLQRLGYVFAPDPDSPDFHSSASRPSARGRITSTSARPAVVTSFAILPSETSCVSTAMRRQGTPRSSVNSSRATRRTASHTSPQGAVRT